MKTFAWSWLHCRNIDYALETINETFNLKWHLKSSRKNEIKWQPGTCQRKTLLTDIPELVTLKQKSSDYFEKQPGYKIRLKILSNLSKDVQEVRDIIF